MIKLSYKSGTIQNSGVSKLKKRKKEKKLILLFSKDALN